MGTGYTTLDDLEARLERAVDDGVLTEQEANEELMYAMEEERHRAEQAQLEEEMWEQAEREIAEQYGF